jgi:hypothetical protein
LKTSGFTYTRFRVARAPRQRGPHRTGQAVALGEVVEEAALLVGTAADGLLARRTGQDLAPRVIPEAHPLQPAEVVPARYVGPVNTGVVFPKPSGERFLKINGQNSPPPGVPLPGRPLFWVGSCHHGLATGPMRALRVKPSPVRPSATTSPKAAVEEIPKISGKKSLPREPGTEDHHVGGAELVRGEERMDIRAMYRAGVSISEIHRSQFVHSFRPKPSSDSGRNRAPVPETRGQSALTLRGAGPAGPEALPAERREFGPTDPEDRGSVLPGLARGQPHPGPWADTLRDRRSPHAGGPPSTARIMRSEEDWERAKEICLLALS